MVWAGLESSSVSEDQALVSQGTELKLFVVLRDSGYMMTFHHLAYM